MSCLLFLAAYVRLTSVFFSVIPYSPDLIMNSHTLPPRPTLLSLSPSLPLSISLAPSRSLFLPCFSPSASNCVCVRVCVRACMDDSCVRSSHSTVHSFWTSSPLPFLETPFDIMVRLQDTIHNFTENHYSIAPRTTEGTWAYVAGRILPAVLIARPSAYTNIVLEAWVYQVARLPSDSFQLLYMHLSLNHGIASTWHHHRPVHNVGMLPEAAFPSGKQVLKRKDVFSRFVNSTTLICGDGRMEELRKTKFGKERLWLVQNLKI